MVGEDLESRQVGSGIGRASAPSLPLGLASCPDSASIRARVPARIVLMGYVREDRPGTFVRVIQWAGRRVASRSDRDRPAFGRRTRRTRPGDVVKARFKSRMWQIGVVLAPLMSLALVLEAGRRWAA